MTPGTFAMLRHGLADNNAADAALRGGDQNSHDEVVKYPSTLHDLTPEGREQAKLTGRLLREFGIEFRHYVVSDHVRAMRTAQLLDIEGAQWVCDPRFGERDSGIINALTPEERDAYEQKRGPRYLMDRFRIRPDWGESFLEVEVRVRQALEHMPERALIVTHGHVMNVTDTRIVRQQSSWNFEPRHPFENGELIEYERDERDPFVWRRRRSVLWRDGRLGEWERIERVRCSNGDLANLIDRALARRSIAE